MKIKNGIAGTTMTSVATQLSDDDVWRLVAYAATCRSIRSVAGGAARVESREEKVASERVRYTVLSRPIRPIGPISPVSVPLSPI